MGKSLIDDLAGFVPRVLTELFVADPSPPSAPGVRQSDAAVLFADISGFTKLAETLGKMGPGGIEELTRTLNADIGCLIDAIQEHGGDIIKFAGDALLAVWPTDSGGLEIMVRRAACCALEAQERFQQLPTAAGLRIAVKIAVGAGPVSGLVVGGVNGRWEMVAAGEALRQITAAVHRAQPGDVVLSPQAWEYLRGIADGRSEWPEAVRLASISGGRIPATPLPALRLAPDRDPALRCFVPPSVLAYLESGRSDWIGELRRVTVMFAHFPGMSSQTPLERAQSVMQVLQSVLYRYEGTINKLSVDDKGSALLGALGLPPLAHEDDAVRATLAGIEIWRQMQAKEVRTSVGIATGRAFCGVIGNTSRREYTMIGDVVNLAARLMQAADGGILCSESTQIEAQSHVCFESLEPIPLKGKSGLVRIFRPRPELPVGGGGQLQSVPPMVGRESERGLLAQRLDRLVGTATGGTILIEGGPGIGKSRLVNDFAEQVQTRGILLLRGCGSHVERSTPYFAWRPVFNRLVGMEGVADREERERIVAAQVSSCSPAFEDRLPLANPALSTDFPDVAAMAGLSDAARAEAAQELLVELLAAIPQREVARVVILEDVHWMDSASWKLALRVSQSGARVLLALATRPRPEGALEEYAELRNRAGTDFLELSPVSAADSLRIVCRRLGVDRLPEPLAAVIREKAEGNPLFAEELAYALRDVGWIVVSEGSCELAPGVRDLGDVDVPPTVQAAMTARIDRLPLSHQLLLKTASVVGRQFAARMVRQIYPLPGERDRCEGMLAELKQRELTWEVAEPGEPAYLFRHAVLQDVAYNLMLSSQRRQLHRAMAEWLEQNPGELSSPSPALAHHWGRVVDFGDSSPEVISKAADYFHQAAAEALRSFANREAISFLRESLRYLLMLPETAERNRRELAIQAALGGPLIATRGFAAPEVEQACLRARELCRDGEISLERFHTLRGLWNYYLVKTKLREARELARELYDLGNSLGDPAVLLPAHRALAENSFWVGDLPAAAMLLEQALQLCREQQGRLNVATEIEAGVVCLGFMAWVLWLRGYPDRSARVIDEAFARARELSQPNSIAITYQNLAMLSHCRRDAGSTQRWAEAQLDLAQKEGFQLWVAAGAVMHGWAISQQGRSEEGIAEMRRGLAEWRSAGAALVVPYYLCMLADAYGMRGEWAEALALLEEAIRESSASGEGWGNAEILRGRGRAQLALGCLGEAEGSFREAISIAHSQDAKSLELRATRSLAELLARQGRQAEAVPALTAILAWFQEGFDTADFCAASGLLNSF